MTITPRPTDRPDCTVVVGAQWGNEGKGKLVTKLCKSADVCARFNGGANNIHTFTIDAQENVYIGRVLPDTHLAVPVKETIVLRLFPLGVANKKCQVVFGNGMVLHLPTLLEEIKSIQSTFDAAVLARVHISSRAHVVFGFHQEMDNIFDDLRENKLGTSQKGIGPAYSTKTIRNGLRMGDLFSERPVIREKLVELVAYFTKYHPELQVDVDQVLDETLTIFAAIKDRVVDTVAVMDGFMQRKLRIVCEGSNSVMSDIDFGTYPFVTSSNTTPGSACLGLGFPPTKIGKVVGVCKAYTTRAQHWFPSEVDGPVAALLIAKGHEVGTTSNKPRRVGWLDLVQVKHAHSVSGFDSLFITKLDALSGMDRIGVVTGYEGIDVENDGYPSTPEEFASITPIIQHVPGWTGSLASATSIADLPEPARNFNKKIETYIGVPVEFVQIGSQDTVLTDRDIIQ